MLPRGIRGRLFLLIGAVALPVVMLLGVFYYQRYEARRQDTLNDEIDLAIGVANTFNVYIEGVRSHMEAIGHGIQTLEPFTQQKANHLMTLAVSDYPAIRNVSWLSPKAEVVASSDSRFVGAILHRDYIQQVADGRPWALGNIQPRGATTDAPTIGLAVGIHDQTGRLVGIMLAGIEPSRLGELMLAEKRPKDASYALFDRDGVLIYRYPEGPLTWQQRLDWKSQDSMLQQAISTGQPHSGIDDLPMSKGYWIAARVPVPDSGYIAGAAQSVATAMAGINRDFTRDTVLVGLVLLLAFAAALVVSTTITRPIVRLESDARAVRGGTIVRRRDPLATAEVAELRGTLERLVDDLLERAAVLRRYQLLATHNSDILLFIRREDGRIIEANAAAQAAYGYSRDELLAMTIYDLRASRTTGLPVAEQIPLQADEAGALFETVHRRRDGREFPAEVSSRGTIIDGQWTVVSIIRDITDRKRAEEQLRDAALFPEENPFPVLRIDAEGRLLYANPASAILKSWRCEEGGLVPPKIRRLTGIALETGQRQEWMTICEGRNISFIFSPVVARRTVNVYGRDVTDIKQAERQLREYSRQLEQRVRERTAQLRVRADQLRMLTGELTLAEQRERRRLARVLHDHLQQLLAAAKYRLAIVRKCKDESVRESAGEVDRLLAEAVAASRSLTAELSPPILHEAGLVPALHWLARWMADRHGLAVKVQTDGDHSSFADDVKVLLFESVRELLFNVVKHAQVSEATVQVRATPAPGQSPLPDGGQGVPDVAPHGPIATPEYIQIIVSDRGVGFDSGLIRPGGSTGALGGFGLFSIRERLELMGGRMDIDSRPGRGSRFTLTAPLRAMSHAIETGPGDLAPASTPPPRPLPQPTGTPSGRIRVLLADDHAVMREGLVRLLEQEPDIDVIGEAADGQEAVDLAGQLLADVVLMDLSMPRLNGVDATRAIHARMPHVRIIGLSMFEEADQAQAMIDAGATSYCTKSCPASELLTTIRAAVSGKAENAACVS
jgi:PAS domain S-box-containing protein